jgi:hypothetical protein
LISESGAFGSGVIEELQSLQWDISKDHISPISAILQKTAAKQIRKIIRLIFTHYHYLISEDSLCCKCTTTHEKGSHTNTQGSYVNSLCY